MATIAFAPSVPLVNNASSTEQQSSTIQLSLPRLLQMFQQSQLTLSTSSRQSSFVFPSKLSGFAMTDPEGTSKHSLILDLGASFHITPHTFLFSSPSQLYLPSYIFIIEGIFLSVNHSGIVSPNTDTSVYFTILSILHIP